MIRRPVDVSLDDCALRLVNGVGLQSDSYQLAFLPMSFLLDVPRCSMSRCPIP